MTSLYGQAAALRATGLTYKQVAARLRVPTNTVYRWLNADYAERERATARAWKAAHRAYCKAYDAAYHAGAAKRGRCRRCGGLMGRGRRQDGVCRGCRSELSHARHAEIARRWQAGESLREIAKALGVSKNAICSEMARMRATGWELPYRWHLRAGR